MAMIAMRVPDDTAFMLENVGPPGDNHAASDMHVTVLYLGDNVSAPRLGLAMVAVQEVAAMTTPFLLSVNRVDSFPTNDGGNVPIIAPVDSPPLHQMQAAIKAAMNKHGVWYSDKYPEYRPHVTLSYSNETKATGSLQSPLMWGAYGVDVYGGNEGMEGIFIHVPFGLPAVSLDVKMASVTSKLSKNLFGRL